MSPVRLRLREVAQAQGMNMTQLQRKSGLDLGMVRRYWYNKTGQISLEALGVLSNILNVKPGDLLTDEPEIRENDVSDSN